MQEEYYPRGGSKPKLANGDIKTVNLFTTLHTKRKRKGKQLENVHESNNTVEENLRLTCAELLTYERMVSGMAILGCVRGIASYAIEVELPGRTCAKIEINAISESLTKHLLEHAENKIDSCTEDDVLKILSKLFTIRQFLPVYIIDISEDEDRSKRVMGSLNPKHINAHLKHTAITKGMVIWGAILEKADYVYVVELGIKNSRAILPFKNCADKVFVEGQPAWFIIMESKIQDNICTLTISANEDDICHSVIKNGHIDQIAPGMCVEFTVSKVLKDGLQGTFFEEYLGYINQVYLNTPMDSLQKYKDATIKAYVLYIHPMTKFTFLTTRNLHLPQEPSALLKGHIGSAKIISNLGKGVAVQFKKNELGFVTYKRLLKSLKLNDSSDISELVKRKFPVGSTHNCRIMDYINMDKMYICTFEQSELKEEVFNVNDLKIGQLVKGFIEGINSSGITVKIGKLIGFVTNEHISNVQYSDNLKRNYRIGDQVTARVWFINGNNIKLTLKQGFVKEDKCLTSYKMAKKNDEYKGMVVNTFSSGVLVVFYGGVKGWLRFVDASKDYQNMFYQGQIINVTITEKHTNKLFLSLDKPENLNHRKLQIGQCTSGTVESVDTNGIVIRTAVGSFQGLLPTNHILINCKLSNIMKNLYKEGDIIENLMCIAKDKGRILSLRESTYYKDDKFYVPRRNQLKQGLVLRCSIKSFQKKRLLLTSPILFFNGFIEVNSENIMEGGESLEDVDFAEGQAVIAKLIEVSDNVVKATVKLSDVFDYDFQYPVDLLRRYLTEIDKIQQKLILRGDNIAQYKIGQRINCEIMKINNIGCSIRLNDGVQGIVAPEHWPNKPLIGSFHEGVVLYVNFIDKYLEISLNNTTNQKISKEQGKVTNIQIGQVLHCKILLIRPELILCCLGHAGNKQIGYMPTALHENDFKPNYTYYRSCSKSFKFIVTSIMNNKIIGLEKGLKQSLDKKNKLLSKTCNKRKRSESDAVDLHKKPKKKRISFEKIPEIDEESNTINGLRYNVHLEEKSSEASDSESNLEENFDEVDKMGVSEKLVDEEGSGNESNVNEDSSEEEGSESEEANSTSKVVISSDSENEQQEMQEEANISEDHNKTEENINHENGEIELDSERKGPVTNKRRVSFSVLQDHRSISDGSLSPEKFVPPGVDSFFDSEDNGSKESSDEDTTEKNSKPKKKKLTRAEQAELLKQQEEELRKKELEFAEPKGTPESAEQFDRRLLAEPNSSELWAKYVSFLLSTAELDKARSVMKRALQTVDQKAEQERMNLWITYLNVENNYGTEETFKQVFDEAVRCNDDFTIYMEAINILSSSKKSIISEYIKKARAKFKQNPKMYTDIGKIYYLQKNFDEARKLRNIALTTLTNNATHIPLTVQFATMEFTYGEDFQAEALFETVLQSNPKRVDVWTSYVDQLVKKSKIGVARRVLERAVSQKLNLKKMRTLHKKFQQFEVKYGNDETRAEWQKLFENYTKQFGKLHE